MSTFAAMLERFAKTPRAFQRIGILIDILTDIDKRLRALEPCPESRGRPHTWAPIGKKFADPGDPLRCIYCGMVKP